MIVEWAAGASPVERRAAREEADVDFATDLGSRRFQLVETEPWQTPREAVRELEVDPAVLLAQRDGYDGLDSVPNDPFFGQLWGLQNTGLGIEGFVGADAATPETDGDPTDDDLVSGGHGVHTAGTIGAEGKQRHRHQRGRPGRQHHAVAGLLPLRGERRPRCLFSAEIKESHYA